MSPSLLLLLSLGVFAAAENPGIKATFTNKGLHYVTQVGTEWLQDYILHATIPAISGEVSLSLLGSVHYTLSSMGVVRLNLPLPSVGFSEGKGLQVDLTGLNMAVKGKWSARYHFIRDGGTFRLGLFNIGLSLQLQVGSDEAGHLNISSLHCSTSLQSIDILFHGGASWIIQLFVKSFSDQIQAQAQQKICPLIEQSIQALESHLAAMNVSFQVSPDLLLDLPLTSPPAFEASDVNVDLKGEFYSVQTHQEPPFVAQPFVLPQLQGFMLTLGVSEFCLNSAAFAYRSAGRLQADITDKMIPPICPIRLNTTSFGKFIPQLPKLFPNMLMVLHVYASDTPTVSLLPDDAKVQLSASAKAFAIMPNSSYAPLFRVDVSANFSGKFFVTDEKLTGSLILSNLSLTLGATEVGQFQTLPMQKALGFVVERLALPKLNAKLKTGYPIPAIRGTQWSNTVLKVTKGFVVIATDAAVSSLGEDKR